MRARTLGVACSLLLVFAHTDPLSAQVNAPAALGERIRLTSKTATGHSTIKGRVIAIQNDSLVVQPKSDHSRAVAISDISRLEFSNGTKTDGKRGMGWGFLGGAATGAIVGALIFEKGTSPECLPDDFLFCTGPHKSQKGFNAPTGALFGGLLGMTVGGIYGRFHHSERWTKRALGGGSRVGLVPFGNSRGLMVSMKF